MFVISIGATVTTTLIVNAIASNAFGKNNLIALNLAVEGIEAMRDIRDSNWLKYSYDKAACWNMLPNAPTDNCIVSVNLIADTNSNYTVDLDLQKMKWQMTENPLALNLPNNGSPSGIDERYRLWYASMTAGTSRDIFVSTNLDPIPPANRHTQSQFFRMITVSYPGAVAAGATEMTVSSLVQWYEGPIVRQVQIDTILTNYNRVKVSP